jgi:hypothetical protein
MTGDRLTSRALLLLVSALCAAGCSAKKESAQEPAAERAPVAQGERAIKRDMWISQPFTLEDSTEVQVSATLVGGPAVDLYVMAEADFNKWNTIVSKGQATSDLTFEYFDDLSLEGFSHAFTSPWSLIPSGTYYLVLDNTAFGGTAPPASRQDDIATVDFKVASRPPEE